MRRVQDPVRGPAYQQSEPVTAKRSRYLPEVDLTTCLLLDQGGMSLTNNEERSPGQLVLGVGRKGWVLEANACVSIGLVVLLAKMWPTHGEIGVG